MTDQRGRSLQTASAIVGVAAIIATAACSPLPGPNLDPVYLKSGTKPSQAAPQASPASTAPAQRDADVTGVTVWVGRYQDSRGSGDVTFSVVRGATTLSGTWKLRTGGGGPVTAVTEGSGRRLQLRMENTAPECPGTFEGWAEITETSFNVTYRGMDCQGPVIDGRLDLRPR